MSDTLFYFMLCVVAFLGACVVGLAGYAIFFIPYGKDDDSEDESEDDGN